MSKYGVFSGPYFPAFGLNTESYGREKTPYLDIFPAVIGLIWNKSITVTSFDYHEHSTIYCSCEGSTQYCGSQENKPPIVQFTL